MDDKTKLTFVDKCIQTTRYIRAAVMIVLAVYFILIPVIQLISDLNDPGLADGPMPRFLYRWHRTLSAKYEVWARERLESTRAAQLSLNNISGTEWPLFGTVFYLWATETLQDQWQKDHSLSAQAPAVYAKGAIEASTALVTDPDQAAWVKVHWGESYLEKQNLFYRYLLINAMVSYQKLLGDTKYQAFLAQQSDSLAKEIDASPYGLLDDYPGQCYPVDILPAIAAIQRADAVLGTDHSAIIKRAIRAFEGNCLDTGTGLPAYNADSETGYRMSSTRGTGMSFMLIWAPQLWPDASRQWYDKYQQQFWQQDRLVAGFREFPRSEATIANWGVEVDAGPVMAGYGMSANAFGIGAARANGRMDHAYTMSALALTAAWRLPDGTLPMPRLLSDLIDAPYVGEAGLLFSFSCMPVISQIQKTDGKIPLLVYLVVISAIIIGSFLFISPVIEIKRMWTGVEPYTIPLPTVQLIFRALLFLAAIVIYFEHDMITGWFVFARRHCLSLYPKENQAGTEARKIRIDFTLL